MRNTNTDQPGHPGDVRVQEFLDMIAPSVIKFNTDHFICGNTFRCVWALREYPTSTEEQAILKRLGEKDGVTLRIYTRHVNAAEERKIISNAASKNRMERANTNDLQQTVMAESNLQDVATIVAQTHRNREPLLHTAVYIELSASDYDRLKLLQTEVLTELIRSKLNVDRLMLRQQQGFFNGHTNITDSTFVTFGVKGLLQASKSLKNEKYHVDHELQYGTAGCPDLPYGEEGGGPAGGTEGLSPEAL